MSADNRIRATTVDAEKVFTEVTQALDELRDLSTDLIDFSIGPIDQVLR